ncbi:hypothetical protein ACFQZE_14255 [Paenibacillus sp. GCM10027627]|uniref:hypothetical protein n=1 Tax=unclassified Paenibacillus TaxID=185978 RepID=UPI00362A4A7C
MKNGKVALLLILTQTGYAVFTIFWFITALMSFMMFTSPDIFTNLPVMSMIIYVWVYPIVLLVSVISSWAFYHRRSFKGAVIAGLIPLLWVVPILWIFLFNN